MNLKSLFGKGVQRPSLRRALRSESLEPRHLMAGDSYLPFHNALIPEDTNSDYTISPLDALLVINAINAGQGGELVGPGVGKSDGPLVDVSADNQLTPIDALRVINRLNAEGEVGDLVGFSFELTDRNGVVLTNNTASVGQLVQLKAYVQDLRGFDAQGVFTAFLDIAYSDPSKFQVNVGEVQSFKYFFDKIDASNTTSNFKFTFDGQTTAPVTLFQGSAIKSAAAVGASIQAALEALPNIGAGNVIVRQDVITTAADQTAGNRRNSYDIIFVNDMAGKDVGLITFDSTGIVLQAGQSLDATLTDKAPASATSAEAVTAAFRFSDEFTTGRTASLGTENSLNNFNEIGATGGLGAPQNPTEKRLLFSVTLKTLAAGQVTFTPNQAEDFPSHDTLVFPKEIVTPDLIEYGQPFTLTIASGLVAANDAFTVVEDAASAAFNVTSNDQLITGTSFTITALGTTSNGGTITTTADGKSINYRPAANFFGNETFTYTITSNLGTTAVGTVTMTVTAVNDAISVPGQTASTNLGKPVTLTSAQLTQGGTAGPGEDATQTLSIASVVSPSTRGGTVSLANGSVTYTPASTVSGTDTFVIVVTDNGQTNGVNDFKTQSVTVTVTVTNDPPIAVDDSFDNVDEETTDNILDLTANDSAGANDNDDITITSVTPSANATVTIASGGKTVLYSPVSGFVGVDTFTYTITDRGGLTSTATVTVDVQATVLPRARLDRADATEDVATGVEINVLGNDRTNAGAVAVLKSFTQPANGTVTLVDNGTADLSDDKLLYVPNANFAGRDVFTYVMNEDPSGGDDSTGTVTVTVADVNDPPIIAGDNVSGTEDTVTTIAASTLLSNDSPGVGETTAQNLQTLSITAVQAVTAGGGTISLSGTNVIYAPAANFNGNFVFTYTAADSGVPSLSGTGTVTIAVSAVNDAPVVGNDSATTAEDTVATIAATTLLANDTPGPASATDESSQTLTIVAVGTATNGTVALGQSGASVIYTPNANYFGTDTFTYTVRDSGGAETTGTVNMTVTAVNDSPTAVNDTAAAFKGIPVTIAPTSLLANDSPGPANESTQTLTLVSVSNAVNGSVALVNGQIVFTPADGLTGAASFQYTIRDNGQTNGGDDFKTSIGTVNITVQEFVPSSISGFAYWDASNDGVKQAAESGLGGIIVTLTGTAFGLPVSDSYITMADGSYSFTNLAPGTYTVTYANPALLIDGLDTAGAQGDADGIANNNAFTVTIASPGGVDATNYNFGSVGVVNGYVSLMERLASRYFATSPAAASNGLYAALGADGSQLWASPMSGFANAAFVEVSLNAAGTEGVLTVVDKSHNIYTATLGRGKFMTQYDGQGNTVVRVLGGMDQLQFTQISRSAPPVTSARKFLSAVDQFFALDIV